MKHKFFTALTLYKRLLLTLLLNYFTFSSNHPLYPRLPQFFKTIFFFHHPPHCSVSIPLISRRIKESFEDAEYPPFDSTLFFSFWISSPFQPPRRRFTTAKYVLRPRNSKKVFFFPVEPVQRRVQEMEGEGMILHFPNYTPLFKLFPLPGNSESVGRPYFS